jgi:hypothetical protein
MQCIPAPQSTTIYNHPEEAERATTRWNDDGIEGFSQRFTTREPDDRMAEVAIAALDAVFDAERAESPEAVPTLA